MESPGASETADDRAEGPYSSADAEPDFDGGDSVGRYVILRPIGSGGMGVVFLAHDPELDRNIALKVLRPGRPSSRERLRARMMREAQAMAKLNHPNVITVHDVGEHDGRVFLAMDFVEGPTLDQWLKKKKRTWREILPVFIAAGEGIVAAHERGLVHRDFKPDNVLIGKDGTIQVTDFGLVRGVGGADDDSSSVGGTSHGVADRGISLTRVGDAIGTPAYMSPEQHMKVEADARADQFAFCVALYEALYRKRPFPGDNRAELARAVLDGRLRDPPSEIDVPGTVRQVVLRGLSRQPDDRWPSMAVLLAKLDRRVASPGRWWRWGLAAVGATGLAAAIVWPPVSSESACDDASSRLEEVWDDARREEIEAALRETDMPYVDDTWSQVEERLDAWAARWSDIAAENCEASRPGDADRDEQTERIIDRRSACLARRLEDFGALIDVFSLADAEIAENAARAVAALPSVESCGDLDFILSEVEPPKDPKVAERVASLRQRLSGAAALHWAGKFSDAADVTAVLLMDAESLGYEPLAAEAAYWRGLFLAEAGDEEAERHLRRAYFDASALGMAELARDAATQLIFVVGIHHVRHDDALQWAEHAEAQLARAVDPEAKARILGNVGLVLVRLGEFDDGVQRYEQALTILSGLARPEPLDIAEQHANLGAAYQEMGRYDAARIHLEKAVSIREATVGLRHPVTAAGYAGLATTWRYLGKYENSLEKGQNALRIYESVLEGPHPWMAKTHDNLASTLLAMGKNEEALRHYEKAVAIHEGLHGTGHPDVGTALSNMGVVLRRLGRYEDSIETHRRALRIRESTLGRDHPKVAASLNNLGACLYSVGRYEEAARDFKRALEIRRKALGPDHPQLASTLINLAQILSQQERYVEALPLLREALAIRERALGTEHPGLSLPLIALAEGLREAGRPAEALEFAERALAAREAAPGHATSLAQARLCLAKTLVATGKDRQRAFELGRLALETLEQDPGQVDAAESAREWLDGAGR